MAIPESHKIYLERKGYTPSCPDGFDAEELALLTKYGHWMEALVAGAISPCTPEQEHFLQAARGQTAAETPFERVWAKLLRSPNQRSAPGLPAEWAAWSPDAGEENGQGEPEEPAVSAVVGPDYNAVAAEEMLQDLSAARRRVANLRDRIEAERAEILAAVRAELDAVEARYARQLEEANEEVAVLEKEVRARVVRLGRTVRAGDVQAVFYRGRVTWDSRGLEQYANHHPEVRQFRKVGAPGVSLRYRGGQQDDSAEEAQQATGSPPS
jgi:uncharacterized protein YifE (UPF0438 family)